MTRDIIYTANSTSLTPTLWLKADRGVILTDNKISTWQDQSINAYHLEQSNVSIRPSLTMNAINSLPAIHFNGTSWLQKQFNTVYQQPNTIFLVSKYYVQYGNLYILSNTGGTDYHDIIWSSYAGNTLGFSAGNWSYGYVKTPPWDFQINTFVFNNANSKIYENSVHKHNGTVGNLGMDGIKLGTYSNGSSGSLMDIAELIMFDQVMDDNQRLTIENYLKLKYNIYP